MSVETRVIILRITLAVFLAAIIGCERSIKRHSAGLRTFMITSLASATTMLLERELMNGSILQGGGTIYLLSAAVLVAAASISVHSLFRNAKNQIQGLTTAVALWTCCIVGLACGAGAYAIAIFSAIMLLLCLTMMHWLEAYLKNRSYHFEIHLELVDSKYLGTFITTIRRLGLNINDIERNRSFKESRLSVYSISMTIESPELKKYKTHKEIIEALQSLDYVSYIEEM